MDVKTETGTSWLATNLLLLLLAEQLDLEESIGKDQIDINTGQNKQSNNQSKR